MANHQMEMDTDTSTEMLALKSAWLNLSAEVRHLATGCIDSKRPLDFGSASDTATTANPSLTSPQSTYSITNESCVSPTTCSQSSFLSDESQVDFDDMAARIEKELQQILEEATQLDLAVDDPVAIRAVVDHQQQVIGFFSFFYSLFYPIISNSINPYFKGYAATRKQKGLLGKSWCQAHWKKLWPSNPSSIKAWCSPRSA